MAEMSGDSKELWEVKEDGAMTPDFRLQSPLQTAGPMELGYLADWERETNSGTDDVSQKSYILCRGVF